MVPQNGPNNTHRSVECDRAGAVASVGCEPMIYRRPPCRCAIGDKHLSIDNRPQRSSAPFRHRNSTNQRRPLIQRADGIPSTLLWRPIKGRRHRETVIYSSRTRDRVLVGPLTGARAAATVAVVMTLRDVTVTSVSPATAAWEIRDKILPKVRQSAAKQLV